MIARDLFQSQRNPLSGSNNRGDDGKPRSGDVLFAPALVEVKLRKRHATLARAMQTKAEAEKLGKPWIHIELTHGDRKHMAVILPYMENRLMFRMLINYWTTGDIWSEAGEIIREYMEYCSCPNDNRCDRCRKAQQLLVSNEM
jgi:hypothetical protein